MKILGGFFYIGVFLVPSGCWANTAIPKTWCHYFLLPHQDRDRFIADLARGFGVRSEDFKDYFVRFEKRYSNPNNIPPERRELQFPQESIRIPRRDLPASENQRKFISDQKKMTARFFERLNKESFLAEVLASVSDLIPERGYEFIPDSKVPLVNKILQYAHATAFYRVFDDQILSDVKRSSQDELRHLFETVLEVREMVLQEIGLQTHFIYLLQKKGTVVPSGGKLGAEMEQFDKLFPPITTLKENAQKNDLKNEQFDEYFLRPLSEIERGLKGFLAKSDCSTRNDPWAMEHPAFHVLTLTNSEHQSHGSVTLVSGAIGSTLNPEYSEPALVLDKVQGMNIHELLAVIHALKTQVKNLDGHPVSIYLPWANLDQSQQSDLTEVIVISNRPMLMRLLANQMRSTEIPKNPVVFTPDDVMTPYLGKYSVLYDLRAKLGKFLVVEL